ncbi:MAG: hypothetical protein ABGX22_15490 [Pirellulaceae bacterium]
MYEKPLEIAVRMVGSGHPCFDIAEAGVNHNGSLDVACELIDTAAVITTRRPGTGLPPSILPCIVNRKANEDIPAGTALRLEDVA